MAKLRLSPAAAEDLRAIRIYSKAMFGVSVAREYMANIRRVFGPLRERPFLGSPAPEYGAGMRAYSVGSHRLYYEASGAAVLIVRILHSSQDAPSQLTRH